MVTEEALVGWAEICRHMRCNLPEYKKERLRNSGIIMYRLEGRPPKRKRVVYTFPSLLHQFLTSNKNF